MPYIQTELSLCRLHMSYCRFCRALAQMIGLSNTFNIFICTHKYVFIPNCLSASVAQLDAPSDWRPGGRGFNPRRGRQHSFVENDHEIFSTVVLSLPLIQEGQLSVSGERMRTILVSRLED